MGYIIAAYSKNAYKEFLLPAVGDTDYTITLDKRIFETSSSVALEMESVNGEWSFHQQSEYRLSKNGETYFGDPLCGGDMIMLDMMDGKRISLLVIETESPFGAFYKLSMNGVSAITIGSNADCHIRYDLMGLVSRCHAVIRYTEQGYCIEDQSANGIFLDGVRLRQPHLLRFGECIHIFGLTLVFLDNVIAVRTKGEMITIDHNGLQEFSVTAGGRTMDETAAAGEKKKFHRSPRDIPKLNEEPVEIESPPTPKPFVRRPLLMTIGPSFTMAIPMMIGCLLAIYSMNASGGSSGAFMYTGIITAVGSAVLGAMWAVINLRYEKKMHHQEEEHRFQAYSDYLVEVTQQIKQQYEENHDALCRTYPDARTCAGFGAHTPELWNRNAFHEDFLFARLGLGEIPFQVPISVPKQKFTLVKDNLAAKPAMILQNYRMLHQVPVGVDLFRHRLVGVVGMPGTKHAMELVYNLVAQLASSHCYTEVKMAFVYQETPGLERKDWTFAKWLPHVWSEDRKNRYVASDKVEAGDVFFELANMLRIRLENQESGSSGERILKPHYVLFIENPALLEGELISKYVFEREDNVGLTTVLMADGFEELPNECEYIIQWDNEFSGLYPIHVSEAKQPVVFDSISETEMEIFARRISDIEVNEMESGGELPNSLDFFEMHKVATLEQFHVLDRWRKNRTFDTMRALVGQKAGGADCYLDIHEKYHGPHGLIAGTTGSGKSETLQTYMLSLAINFSPLDIAFFIIDFKGGGMANLFSDLPHTIGNISNLSGNQVRRAMVSIKSENLRRQKIFGEYGVNHINGYTRLLKSGEASVPVPHLFIIIDEFAELKREEPEFMRELISVAQVGRSLGVHLILATQKPSGTVDDNIWSNAKFRLCLRVQDRQDSNDMLHKPDAAYITQAGRCYMQVGSDEVFELFQSGWSGAPYRENVLGAKSAIAKMYSLTGKAALVGSRNLMREHMNRRMKWMVSMAEGIQNAAQAIQVSLLDCQENADAMNLLLERAFDILAKMKVDYPDSPYNRRCLTEMIQVWNLVYEPAQTPRQTVALLMKQAPLLGMKLPEMREKTQLDAVVEHLQKVAQANGYNNCMQLWLPVLPEYLYLNQLEGYAQTAFSDGSWPARSSRWNLEAMVGLYDDPVNQAQKPLVVNLAENGHHAVCGTVVSGKSTFLQSLMYSFISRYTPEELNIYALDFSSRMLAAFEDAPHVGGIMYEGDAEKIQKFFHMIHVILQERKQLFKGGNYSQYVQAHGVTVPAIMIVIDNIASFREKTKDAYEDMLIRISRDGAGYGVFLVVASAGFGSAEIPSRIGDNIRTVVSLEMGDKFKYADVLRTTRIEVLPESGVRGRGLALVDGSLLEFQTALALQAEDDYQRSEKIAAHCQLLSESWKGKTARPIPEIPAKPVWDQLAQTEEYRSLVSGGRYLPMGYRKADATVYGMDLAYTYCLLVQGKSRTGKTTLLRNLVQAAQDIGGKLCVIDDDNQSLKLIAEQQGAEYLSSYEEVYQYWQELLPEFQARNKRKKELVAEGLEPEEIFGVMQSSYEPIWIFLSDAAAFAHMAYSTVPNVGAMSGFLENIIEKGSQHHIYFIGGINPDDASALSGYRMYHHMAEYHTGIHLGGNVAAQRIFDFSTVPFAEQTKSSKAGVGLVPAGEQDSVVTEVVIPMHGSRKK